MIRRAGRWNHNIHYYPLILAAVPPGCQRVLDVGCGEGMLARQLADLVPHVSGIDADAHSIDLARRQDPAGKLDLIAATSSLTHPFAPGSFSMITSVTAMHRMDPAAALARMDLAPAAGWNAAVTG